MALPPRPRGAGGAAAACFAWALATRFFLWPLRISAGGVGPLPSRPRRRWPPLPTCAPFLLGRAAVPALAVAGHGAPSLLCSSACVQYVYAVCRTAVGRVSVDGVGLRAGSAQRGPSDQRGPAGRVLDLQAGLVELVADARRRSRSPCGTGRPGAARGPAGPASRRRRAGRRRGRAPGPAAGRAGRDPARRASHGPRRRRATAASLSSAVRAELPCRTVVCTTASACGTPRSSSMASAKAGGTSAAGSTASPGHLGDPLHEALDPRERRTRPRAAPPRCTRSSSGSAGCPGSSAARSGRQRCTISETSTELPSDLLIFSPLMVTQALCTQ